MSTNLRPPKPTRQVPRRASSFATVVPAAVPGGGESSSASFLDAAGRDGILDSSALPSTPKEYVTPEHHDLTPLRAHYLKRELVGGQLARELAALSNPDALSIVGWPFERTQAYTQKLQQQARRAQQNGSASATDDDEETDLPFLRFFLHHFVMTFPFLSQVDINTFYSRKLQPFITSFMARNISVNDEREEETGVQTKRHKLAGKADKHIGLLISSAVKLADNGGREEVVRIVEVRTAPVPSQISNDAGPPPLPPKDAQPRASTSSARPDASKAQVPHHGFEVNVISVRTVTVKSRLRKSKHEEFIVKTSRPNAPDVYVARRYGDFVSLSEIVSWRQ